MAMAIKDDNVFHVRGWLGSSRWIGGLVKEEEDDEEEDLLLVRWCDESLVPLVSAPLLLSVEVNESWSMLFEGDN